MGTIHSIHNTPYINPRSGPAPWFQAILDREQKKARGVEVVEDESMEEQAELEAADLEIRKMMGLRDEHLRQLGYPFNLDNGKLVPVPSWDPHDGQNLNLWSRHLVVNRNNCQDVDIDGFLGLNKPLDKKKFLAKEEGIWRAAMDYCKSKNTVNEVIEDKCTGAITHNVVACVPLDCVDAEMNYLCKVCPHSIGIVHPRNGGLTCGSQEGQKVFHYTIPGDGVLV